MSAFGPKQTWACAALQMSAFGGKAEMRNFLPQVRQPHIGFLWNLYAWNMIAGTAERKQKKYSGA